MPFAKDNQLWKSSHKARAENKDRVQDFLSLIANGGIEAYANCLAKLASKEELSPPEKEFMDRMEKWKDHISAKKAPVDGDGETVRPILVMPAELMEKNDIKPTE